MRTPTWNPQAPEVPVDKNGNWMQYPGYDATYVPVDPFYSAMYVDGMYSGRSAKGVILKDETGKKYPMFIADLVKALQNPDMFMSMGTMRGYWAATKRGANYGVKFVGRHDPSGEL